VQFNERLIHNDGVLAHAQAVAQGCTYAEALEAIEQEAGLMRMAISQGQTIVIKQVGRLYRGANGATHFLPEPELERMLRSFGLQRIALVPVVREGEVVEAPKGSGGSEGGRVVSWPRVPQWAAAAALVPVLAAGTWWWAAQPSSPEAVRFALPGWARAVRVAPYAPVPSADLVPDWSPEAAVAAASYDAWLAALEGSDQSTVCLDLLTGAADSAGFRVQLSSAAPVPTPPSASQVTPPDAESTPPDAESTPPDAESTASVAPTPCTGAYLLVSGAFSTEANAKRHAAALRSAGTTVDCIAQPGGLYLVCIGIFNDAQDAAAAQARAEASGTSAWLKTL
jgi:cell division septation protein DedD